MLMQVRKDQKNVISKTTTGIYTSCAKLHAVTMNRLKKILCLHGSQQNAEIFRTRLGRIPHKLRDHAKFVIIEAPNELPIAAGDSIPMRTWFLKDPKDGVTWDKDSVQRSIDVANQAWLKDGPFDGIIGFSQGGTFATLLAGISSGCFSGVRFIVCIGSPDSPVNYSNFSSTFCIPHHIRSLHLAGLTDAVVSMKSSTDLCNRYFNIENASSSNSSSSSNRSISSSSKSNMPSTSMAGGEVESIIPSGFTSCHRAFITHPQGHCIPMKAAYMEVISTFVATSSYIGDPMPDFIIALMKNSSGSISVAPSNTNTITNAIPDAAATTSASASTPEAPGTIELQRCSSNDIASSQSDEMEALQAIFGEDIEVMTPAPSKKGDLCPIFRIKLTDSSGSALTAAWVGHVSIEFSFTSKYPDESSLFVSIISSESISETVFTSAHRKSLLAVLQASISENKGSVCTYEAIQGALLWMQTGDSISANSATANNSSSSGGGGGGVEVETATADKNLSEKSLWYNVDTEYIDQNDVYFENEVRFIKAATEEAYAASYRSKVTRDANSAKSGEGSDSDEEGKELYSATARGLWKYTVGLVGKPSAGKSTFYNAVTRAALDRDGRRMADVAPHPFTTIEPNIGPGFFAGPLDELADSSISGPARSSLHGRDAATGRRLLPITVKDVAGLVPGAYKGRGKGNKFLNDICDADVLVHVVDTTGRSDRDGNILLEGEKGSSPIEDSEWIREELHRWIFNNIRCKWHSVLRKNRLKHGEGKKKSASRLLDLFSGYKGPRHCAELAVERSGLQLSDIDKWDAPDVHRVVAHYLSIRFPICLGLNKVDSFTDQAEGRATVRDCVAKCLARGEIAVPMSAKAESWVLLKLSQDPSSPAHMRPSIASKNSSEWNRNEAALKLMNEVWGGTGVLEAISAAVALKPPVYCYPVGELDIECPMGLTSGSSILSSEQPSSSPNISTQQPSFSHPSLESSLSSSLSSSLVYGGGGGGDSVTPSITSSSSLSSYCLRDCLMMKPGSTVGDLFDALKHGALPNTIVQGEFVRCEARGLDRNSKKKQFGRDAELDETNCIMKIQTNRKSFWQHLKGEEGKK